MVALRPLLAAAAAVLLAACAATEAPVRAGAASAPPRLFARVQTITSARLVPTVDRTGTPLLRSAVAPLTPFVHPAAVAASGNDFYIADSGARRLYRYDFALAAMAVVAEAPVAIGVRVAVGHDFSVYVLDSQNRRVLRFSRDGRVLASYADDLNLTRPVALAVDDVHGEVFVADPVFNLIVAFHAIGRARQVIPLRGDERNRVMSIAALALGGGGLQIADPLCRCLQIVDRSGRVHVSYGHGELGQPGAIAVDRHARVFVADHLGNSVKVYRGGRLEHEASAAELGVVNVSDIAVSEDRLMIADGAGARVAVLRIAPPRPE